MRQVDWKYIVIDEAQRMKDRQSKLAKDLDRFTASRRLLLTGTPLQNELRELWSLLNLLLPEVHHVAIAARHDVLNLCMGQFGLYPDLYVGVSHVIPKQQEVRIAGLSFYSPVCLHFLACFCRLISRQQLLLGPKDYDELEPACEPSIVRERTIHCKGKNSAGV